MRGKKKKDNTHAPKQMIHGKKSSAVCQTGTRKKTENKRGNEESNETSPGGQ